jgi:FeS assembly SUF system protein
MHRMSLRDKVIAALRMVHDPEMPVNVYELGLIYSVDVLENGVVSILMTLTAPICPVAESLPASVSRAASEVAGVSEVRLELTFDPPWTKDRMSEAAKLAMGFDDFVPVAKLSRSDKVVDGTRRVGKPTMHRW